MVSYRIFVLVLLLTVVSLPVAGQTAPGHLIVNSEDWEDVYSVMLYSALGNPPASFLVSDRHGPLLLNSVPRGADLWIISSEQRPYLIGYADYASSRGYEAEEFSYPSINLEMARQLPSITKFIIVDNAYGYNAIAVAPYAARSLSYVLFANSQSIDEVTEFLEERNPESVLIYGGVDREVADALAQFNPEVINNDGDRFANNVEILKRYQDLVGAKQAILTNGEFIEKEIMSGQEPVVFIGTTNVPDIIRDYIKQSGIEVGVLIGNELVGTATTIRRQLGISVFVKFAQGARAPQGAISQVEALDMFYLPVYNLLLELESVKYNRASGQLEVTVTNTVEQGIYFKGTYALESSDGAQVTAGDAVPEFVGGRETKTLVYDVAGLGSGDITGDIFIVYGESRNSLEKVIDTTLAVDVIDVSDRCQVQLGTEAQFNIERQIFTIPVDNVGSVPCFVDVELIDVVVAGERVTFSTETATRIGVGESQGVRLRTTVEEADLESNPLVTARVYYGERETSLVKTIEAKMTIVLRQGTLVFYSLLIIIIGLLAFIAWRKYQLSKQH